MKILDIEDKSNLIEVIESWDSEDIIGNEMLADSLMRNYVFGDETIIGIDKKSIFYECIEIYCKQVSKGGIHSKWCIASQIIGAKSYLRNDIVLAKFLIDLAAYENQPDACQFLVSKYLEFDQPEVAQFWRDKAQKGFTGAVEGESVELVLDREMEIIFMK